MSCLLLEVSAVIDAVFFVAVFVTLSSNEVKRYTLAIARTTPAKEIDLRLMPIRIVCLLSCWTFLSKSWNLFANNNVLLGFLLLLAAIDTYIVAYNCYQRRYLQLICRFLRYTLRNAKSIFHKSDRSCEDNVYRLRHAIIWEVLWSNTIISFILSPLLMNTFATCDEAKERSLAIPTKMNTH